MRVARAPAFLVVALAAGSSAAGTIQVTASAVDSALERFPASPNGRFMAVRTTADLTPGAPGNADGSAETWRAHLFTGALVQATAANLDATCVRVTIDGDLVFASREDLTPGAPGNLDGSFESWLFRGVPGTLVQMTAGPEDSFHQAFRHPRRTAYLVSKSDLVPGGNADGSNEVYAYDVATAEIRQVTASAQSSLLRGLAGGDIGIVESGGDLDPGNNADGSAEVFLVNLATGAARQITASSGNSRLVGLDGAGRRVAIESREDLVPGQNTDGSLEVFAFDRTTGRIGQMTSSLGDTSFAAFVDRSALMAVHSRQDLATGGNADGSQEVFLVQVVTRAVRQFTSSPDDSTLLEIGDAPLRWAAIERAGEIHVQRVRGVATQPFRLTDGVSGGSFAGIGFRGRRAAFDSTGDLVAGGNADGSREAFLAELGTGVPRVRQITASATADSAAASISGRFPVLVIESRADIVPGGNADGSQEVYLHAFGPLPRR